MLSLVTTFEKSDGKPQRWTVKNVNGTRSEAEIQADLEELAGLNLFEKDGVVLLKKVIKAKIVESIETDLFDLTKKADDEIEASEKKPKKAEVTVTKPKQVPKNLQTDETESVQDQTALDEESTEKSKPENLKKTSKGKLAITGKIPEVPYAVLNKEQTLNKLGIEIPKGMNISKMSQEEFSTFLTTLLPEGTTFEDEKIVEKSKGKNSPRGKLRGEPKKPNGSPPKMKKRQLKKLMKQLKDKEKDE